MRLKKHRKEDKGWRSTHNPMRKVKRQEKNLMYQAGKTPEKKERRGWRIT